MIEKEKMLKALFLLMAVAYPFLATAITLEELVITSQEALNVVIPLFMTGAVAVFVWGVMMYISAGGDAEKEKTARGRIIYGLIGLFVLVAFWGLVTVITSSFDITESGPPFSTSIELDF